MAQAQPQTDQDLLSERIAAAADRMQGMSTRDSATGNRGLENGNLACAYSVNQVLGVATNRTFGTNKDYVPSVVSALKQDGNAQEIPADQIRAGDIAIRDHDPRAGNHQHIGIVLDGHPPAIANNHSGAGRFETSTERGFAHGVGVHYYRLQPEAVDMAWVRSHDVPQQPLRDGSLPPFTQRELNTGRPHRAAEEGRVAEPRSSAWRDHTNRGAAAHSQNQHNELPGIRFGAEIAQAARKHGLDPTLLAAVAAQETGGPGADSGRNVESDRGHGHGIFSIDDRHHEFARGPEAMDPAKNADYAAGYLKHLVDRNEGDIEKALHQYNAGHHLHSAETRWPDGKMNYEQSVLRHQERIQEEVAIVRAREAEGGRAFETAAKGGVEVAHVPQRGTQSPAANQRARETETELEIQQMMIERAAADARSGKVDNVRFYGDGHESARQLARENQKLEAAIASNLPAHGPVEYVAPTRPDGFRQSGKIIEIKDGYVIQDVGRGRTQTYNVDDFRGSVPEVGQSYTVAYHRDVAAATLTRPAVDLAFERGR